MKVTKCDICNGETDMDIRLSVISNGDYQMIGADLCYLCFGRMAIDCEDEIIEHQYAIS